MVAVTTLTAMVTKPTLIGRNVTADRLPGSAGLFYAILYYRKYYMKTV
jgi:hypothetical protein